MLPLQAEWELDGVRLKGPDYASGALMDTRMFHGVLDSGSPPAVFQVVLKNTAQARKMQIELESGRLEGPAERLMNVRLYLTGGDSVMNTLMLDWPARNAGVEVSFDGGLSWTRFSGIAPQTGYEPEPASWITVPAIAVGEGASDGVIGAFAPLDRARLLLRIVPPVTADETEFGLYDFTLGVDYDVI